MRSQVWQSLLCLCELTDVLLSILQILLDEFDQVLLLHTRIVTCISLSHTLLHDRHSQASNIVTICIYTRCNICWQVLIHTTEVEICKRTECLGCRNVTLLLISSSLLIDCREHCISCLDELVVVCPDEVRTGCILVNTLILCPWRKPVVTRACCYEGSVNVARIRIIDP